MSFTPQCVEIKKSTCHKYLRSILVNLAEVERDDLYYEVLTTILTLPIYLQRKTFYFPPFQKTIRHLTEKQKQKKFKRTQKWEFFILNNKIETSEGKLKILPEDSYFHAGAWVLSGRAVSFNRDLGSVSELCLRFLEHCSCTKLVLVGTVTWSVMCSRKKQKMVLPYYSGYTEIQIKALTALGWLNQMEPVCRRDKFKAVLLALISWDLFKSL